MRRVTALLPTIALSISAAVAAGPKPPAQSKAKQIVVQQTLEARKTPIASLVTAEQEFSRLAGRTNVRNAFLENLSPDAVLFAPLPVNGVARYQARPATSAKLAWRPEYAEVSASGDFGVTTGPWEWTPPDTNSNHDQAYGNFLTVWRRTPGQPWKVVLDCGVSHAKPDAGLEAVTFTPGPEPAPAEAGADSLPRTMMQSLDDALSRMADLMNPPRAVVSWTAGDLRYLREGDPPRAGDDARNAMSAAPAGAAWQPIDGAIAGSGDLGYTYGVRVDRPDSLGQAPDSTVYVHIWRLGAGRHWKIAAAVDTPLEHR